MGLIAALANAAWWAAGARSHKLFRRALADPAHEQESLLMHNIHRNAGTAFGRAHRFESIRSPEDFSRRVALSDYDSFVPWIDRIAGGERNVLTADRVLRFATTSGSSRARKLIPHTTTLQREFDRAIAPWIVDLYRSDPQIARGCAYWSVSPLARDDEETTRSAIPIGFVDDAEYVGGVRSRLVSAVMAVPADLRHAGSVENFRYLTLLLLLRRRDLRLISVWHPSFLSLLLDTLPAFWPTLLRDIRDGGCSHPGRLSPSLRNRLRLEADPSRARVLFGLGPMDFPRIWPNLRLISCWADSFAEGPAEGLCSRFPGVRIQPKGLIATEAFVTIPFAGLRPLAVRSHYFEFLDGTGKAHPAHALRQGETYSLVVTTGGGLWRYKLGDLVEVTGYAGRTPSLRFLAREGNISDRFGEKLSEGFVADVLHDLFAALEPRPTFAMLAPDTAESVTRYTLYVEGDVVAEFGRALDAALRSNPHYAYCRDLGQLEQARIFRIRGSGYATFSARLTRGGMRLGDIKPSPLSRLADWSSHFDGDYAA